ncbi:MAG: hypothetical protein OXT09_09300 [Myxococcales bacterium]|nr:hypothetical protein [Myxococcales bacterium]
MHTKLLIDNIVRQTTILIAELSTAAGVRAPLSHIADQVFVELARAIEAQGVGRKVVADMFGLALRTYQKRVQRLEEGATVRDRTLWEAVLDFLRDNGGATRSRIFERFKRDEERDVGAVLNDLVGSGLVYVSGRGDRALYGLTPDDDRQRMAEADREAARSGLLWMAAYRLAGATEEQLAEAVGMSGQSIAEPLAELEAEGRIECGDDGKWRAATLTIPVGAQAGWEAAVFDHYQAVAKAIAHKLRGGSPRSESRDVIGGATLSFDVHPGHPHGEEVYALLHDIRAQVNALWDRVSTHNRDNPPPPERDRVTFYFGQNVEELDESEPGEEGDVP